MIIDEFAVEKYRLDQKKLAKTTLESNIYRIQKFVRYFYGFDMNSITAEQIEGWCNYLSSTYNYKPATIKRILTTVKHFFSYYYDEEIINTNVAADIEYPKVSLSLPRVLFKNEILSLKQAVQNNILYEALIELYICSGLRLHEALELEMQNINWNALEIHIIGKGAKERTVPFTAVCKMLLERYLSTRSDQLSYLFVNKRKTNHIHRRTVENEIRHFGDLAGLAGPITPQLFRYTYATILFKNGFDIAEIAKLMGHDSIKTTQRYINAITDLQAYDENWTD